MSDVTDVQYKCTGQFNAEGDRAIRWNDPNINIEWPVISKTFSEKDKNAPMAREYFCE